MRILDRRMNEGFLAPRDVAPSSRACFWTTYALFALSLFLPACRHDHLGFGPANASEQTMYGYQCLPCGFPANAGFLIGIFGFSLPRWLLSFAMGFCILGFVQGLVMSLLVLATGGTLEVGIFLWLGSLYGLLCWFSRFDPARVR